MSRSDVFATLNDRLRRWDLACLGVPPLYPRNRTLAQIKLFWRIVVRGERPNVYDERSGDRPGVDRLNEES